MKLKIPNDFPIKYALIVAIAIIAVGGGYAILGNNTHTTQAIQPATSEHYDVMNDSQMIDNLENSTDEENALINNNEDTSDLYNTPGTLHLTKIFQNLLNAQAVTPVIPVNNPPVVPPIQQPENPPVNPPEQIEEEADPLEPPAENPEEDEEPPEDPVEEPQNPPESPVEEPGEQIEEEWDPFNDPIEPENPEEDYDNSDDEDLLNP